MAPNPEAGSETKQSPILTIEEELQQWRAHATNLKQQIEDKELEVQTLQAVATGKNERLRPQILTHFMETLIRLKRFSCNSPSKSLTTQTMRQNQRKNVSSFLF